MRFVKVKTAIRENPRTLSYVTIIALCVVVIELATAGWWPGP